MAEGDRLCDLQMGEARHRRRRFAFGEVEQVFLELAEQDNDVVDRIAQVEPDVGCHLIIA